MLLNAQLHYRFACFTREILRGVLHRIDQFLISDRLRMPRTQRP